MQDYQLISPRIAAFQTGLADSLLNGPVSGSYAGVFFTKAMVRIVRLVQWIITISVLFRLVSWSWWVFQGR